MGRAEGSAEGRAEGRAERRAEGGFKQCPAWEAIHWAALNMNFVRSALKLYSSLLQGANLVILDTRR